VKLNKRPGALAMALAGAMLLSACGGGDDNGSGDSASSSGGGEFSIYIGDPENPLIPGNTTETEGGQVVDTLWTGLVTYDPDTSEATFDGVAESIESEDQTTWTVTLKDGWTFHDGTPVNAQSYVDAWNWTANSANAAGNSYFFANIEGYDDLQAPVDPVTEEPTGEPAAQEMSGLEVVSDTEFTITLSSAFGSPVGSPVASSTGACRSA
jgi:oligopeptide transport system substrate-binding protein